MTGSAEMPTPIRTYLVTYTNVTRAHGTTRQTTVSVGATSSHVTDESDIPTILAVSRTGNPANSGTYIVLSLVPIDLERQA
jgi:hypothetical protein